MSRARTRPIAHIVVTAVARVQSVSAVVHGTALPDPGVDRGPVHFAHWGPGIGGVTHPTVGRCELGGDVRFGSKADITL
jgi:hypothetical protein